MKEAVSVLLLAVLIFSGCLPALAQNSRSSASSGLPGFFQTGQKGGGPQKKDDSTKFDSAEAFTSGSGVWIHWRMDNEVDNAGFNLYRTDKKGRKLLVDNFTPGAGARSRNGRAVGEQYSTFDPKGNLNTSYEIESVSLSSNDSKTIRVSPQYVSDLSTVVGDALPLLEAKSYPGALSVASADQVLPDDLSAQVSSFQQTPDPNQQKFIASQPGVKIGVKNAGIYRVSRTQLQNAGFNVNSDPSLWQLYTDGVEQAITVDSGANYIEFYGKAIDTPGTDVRTFFLIVGASAGKRIASRLSRPGLSTVVSPGYDQTFSLKEHKWLLTAILNGDAENYWGSVILASGATTIPFNLSGLPPSGNVVFNFSALGYSFGSHGVNLTLNGHVLTPMTGFGDRTESSVQYTLPVSYLVEGANSLVLQATGSANDTLFFDTLSLGFVRKYLASQNQLSFHTENFKIATLDGFTSPNIRVFDTTNDGSPVLVNNLPIQQNGATYSVTLPAAQSRVFFAVEDSGIQQAVSVVPNAPSTLSTPNHNATLVIISYPDFANLPVDPTCTPASLNYPGCLPPAQQWAVYRQGQGTLTEVVKVDDIYDEFNYGADNPNAIRDFLNYAKNNWPTAPKYVLLIGDSSNDPKNYLPSHPVTPNYIPVKSVNGDLGEVDCDDALADFNIDGLADMAIGRIPARQASNIIDVLNKVKVFESNGQTLATLGTLWGYDTGTPEGLDSSGNGFFYDQSTTLASQLPVGTKTYISRLAPQGADPLNSGNGTAAFISAINAVTSGNPSGQHPPRYIVNYSGHGSTSLMGYGPPRLLSYTDLVNSGTPTLTNTAAPSLFVSLSCLNAYFTDPQLSNTSLGELLLSLRSGNLTVNAGANTGGGAVAVWGSTAETTPDVQLVMGNEFYKQVGLGTLPGKTDPRLGDFIIDAKAAISFGQDVRSSWVLLGDPMLKLKAQ